MGPAKPNSQEGPHADLVQFGPLLAQKPREERRVNVPLCDDRAIECDRRCVDRLLQECLRVSEDRPVNRTVLAELTTGPCSAGDVPARPTRRPCEAIDGGTFVITTVEMLPMSTPISMVVEQLRTFIRPTLNSPSYSRSLAPGCCAECSAARKNTEC